MPFINFSRRVVETDSYSLKVSDEDLAKFEAMSYAEKIAFIEENENEASLEGEEPITHGEIEVDCTQTITLTVNTRAHAIIDGMVEYKVDKAAYEAAVAEGLEGENLIDSLTVDGALTQISSDIDVDDITMTDAFEIETE
jgi:hypothetical protein